MSRFYEIHCEGLLKDCPSLTLKELEALSHAHIVSLLNVDVNWCLDEERRNEYQDEYVTEEAAIETAIYAQYEEIQKELQYS